MNTERLHILARHLQQELARSTALQTMQQVTKDLGNQIREPQQPAHQQQLAKHLRTLYAALDSSPVNSFSPGWRDAMEEMGIAQLFGSALASRIRTIFENNQITPQVALDELNKIVQKLTSTDSAINGLVTGLGSLGVGEDALTEEECEIGFAIPRTYVKDNLKNFGTELVELEKLLLVFSELVTGKRQPLTLRQISSSDLSIFLEYAPEIGACIAIAVERIVALYKQLLEIKTLKNQLGSLNVPEAALQGIDKHSETIVTPALEELAKELLDKYGSHLKPDRRNEVAIELKYSINKLANRIDRGFSVELRVGPPPEPTSQSEDESDTTTEARQTIIDASASIQQLGRPEAPVLFLPEKPPSK